MIQTSTLADFRTAYDIGKSTVKKDLEENPVLDTIRAFAEDKRVQHFEEDLPQVIGESIHDSLDDANRLRESAAELNHLIARLSKIQTGMIQQADEIITARAEAGIEKEGNFEIIPLEKKSNRKVNRDLIVSEHKAKFDLLLANKIEDLQKSYTPTIKEVEAVFGKKADTVLIPGSVQIVGYDIKLISPMPEQASAGVEL